MPVLKRGIDYSQEETENYIGEFRDTTFFSQEARGASPSNRRPLPNLRAYSYLSAVIGFNLAAFRAGKKFASNATAIRSRGETTKVTASVAVTS